jgi:hypothetical protein
MSDFKLPTDQYYIRNEETFAGRDRHEDLSLLPKRVNCPTDGDLELASTLRSTLWPYSHLFKPFQWHLERLDNGRYKLKTRGAPTGERNKLLFAFLIDIDKAEEWIITKRKDDGHRSQYT